MENTELTECGKSEIAKKYLVKSVAIGDHGVGKSTIIHLFVNKYFSPSISATVGAAFAAKNIILSGCNNQEIKFQVWDTAGSERFRSLARLYFRNVDVSFIVFDLTDRKTWNHVDTWKKDLDKHNNVYNFIPIIVLIGCKSDLKNHVVTPNEIQMKAEEWKCRYYIISCKEDNSVSMVNEIFTTAIEDFHKMMISNINNGIEIPLRVMENEKTTYINISDNNTWLSNNCCS